MKRMTVFSNKIYFWRPKLQVWYWTSFILQRCWSITIYLEYTIIVTVINEKIHDKRKVTWLSKLSRLVRKKLTIPHALVQFQQKLHKVLLTLSHNSWEIWFQRKGLRFQLWERERERAKYNPRHLQCNLLISYNNQRSFQFHQSLKQGFLCHMWFSWRLMLVWCHK